MKKILLIFILTIITISANSQYGYKGAYVIGGYTLQDGANINIGYEMPSQNFHIIETYLHYYQVRGLVGDSIKINDTERNYSLGIAYKHNLIKSDRFYLHFKLGGEVGTTTHKFIFSGVTGFQTLYNVTENVGIIFLLDGGYYYNTIKDWRVNLNGGLRFSF